MVLAYRFRLARGLGSEASNEGLVSGLKSSQLCFRFLMFYVVLYLVEFICICWQEVWDPRPRFRVQVQAWKVKNLLQISRLAAQGHSSFRNSSCVYDFWFMVLGFGFWVFDLCCFGLGRAYRFRLGGGLGYGSWFRLEKLKTLLQISLHYFVLFWVRLQILVWDSIYWLNNLKSYVHFQWSRHSCDGYCI